MTASITESLRTCDDRTCRFRRITGGGIRCALEITHRCNLTCPHCFVDRDGLEPLTSELISVLRQLSSAHCRKIVLTGGEPLLVDGLEAVVATCAEQEILVDLNSNLIALNAEFARTLVAAGLSEASVSLYGAEAVHDRFVGHAGAFARTVRGIRLLRDLGVPVDVHSPLGAHNAAQINSMADVCVRLDCASLTFFTILQPGPCWCPGPDVLASIAELRTQCTFPVRTIGVVPGDLVECVMGESIMGITAGLILKPCLLAAAHDAGRHDLRNGRVAEALAEVRKEVTHDVWKAACCATTP